MTKPTTSHSTDAVELACPTGQMLDDSSGIGIVNDGLHPSIQSKTQVSDTLWRVLQTPAFIGRSSLLQSKTLRLRIEAARHLTEASLADVLGMAVKLEFAAQDHEFDPESGVFAIELDMDGFEAPILVTLDLGTTRTLIDALGSRASGLRGKHVPTPAECGVVEYVVLACFSSLHRRLGITDRVASLRTLNWICNSAAERSDDLVCWRFTVRCGGGKGIVSVSLPSRPSLPSWVHQYPNILDTVSEADSIDEKAAADDFLKLELRWPPISLSVPELAQLEPGDRILTDCEELVTMHPLLQMGTTSGWIVADCRVLTDEAGWTKVQCDSLEVRVSTVPEEGCDNSERMLDLTMGSAKVDRMRFEQLQTGAVLAFTKASVAPVRIACMGVQIARGELESVNGQVAVHVVSVSSKALQEVVA